MKIYTFGKTYTIVINSIFISFLIATAAIAEERIISTNPAITVLLGLFKQDHHIVGADSISVTILEKTNIENIGYHRQLSTEGLLSLKPTKLFGTTEMGPKNTLKTISGLGVDVIQLKNAQSLTDLQHNVMEIGKIFKDEKVSQSLIENLSYMGKQLEKYTNNQSCIFLLNIGGHKMRIAGIGTTGDAYIKLLGAKNLANFNNYREASSESLFAKNPECIILAGENHNTAIKELLSHHKKLALLPAIRKNSIYAIESKHLIAGISISAVNEAIHIAKKLHNE